MLSENLGDWLFMRKSTARIPKNYNGIELTTHNVGHLLSAALSKLHGVYQESPELVMAAWSEIIGPKLVSMTQVVSFCDGILTVKVKNATLLSLLSRHDKPRILAALRQKFPRVNIANIIFRIA